MLGAEKYEEAINRSEKQENFRQVAVIKYQLAMLRHRQQRYGDAWAGYREALNIFADLNEPAMVAGLWHQIGMVYQDAGQYEEAENAYRRSLEIETQRNDLAGQADCLIQLGTLYADCLHRLGEAVTCFRQAADIYEQLQNVRYEGLARTNIAETLRQRKHYDEARQEINRAIECAEEIGIAAEPWKTFKTLHKIEASERNTTAAKSAWQQARDSYFAYRRQGADVQTSLGKLADQLGDG